MEAIWRKNELNHNLNSDKNISNYHYLFSAGKKFLGRAKIIDHCFYNNAHFVCIIITIFELKILGKGNSRSGGSSSLLL